MNDIATKLADRLQQEGDNTVAFFIAIPENMWSRELYSDGERWNIYQILVHIVQAEDSIFRLISGILRGHPGVPEDFNLDAYNHRKVDEMAGLAPEYLLPLFSERRTKTVALVASVDDGALEQIGRHPFLGEAPVVEMLKLMYRHTQLHQRDIRKFLKDTNGENA